MALPKFRDAKTGRIINSSRLKFYEVLSFKVFPLME